MESGTPPKAPSPKQVNNTEASSQKDPGQGGEEKTVRRRLEVKPQGPDTWGKRFPWELTAGAILNLTAGWMQFQRPIRLQNQAGSLP